MPPSAVFDFDSLNQAQRQAVETLEGPVLILAGAGTGKTRTVTCRIIALMHNGVSPQNILAVTFTNKAAREMRERLQSMTGKKKGAALTVCTFHSLCLRILRQDIEALGYRTNFSILSGSDQQSLARELLVKKAGPQAKLTPGELLAAISQAKNTGRPLADLEDDLLAHLATTYAAELRLRNALDFDDLLLLTERLLRENSLIRERWQRHFTHLTVDEFQDTNALQLDLLCHLVGPQRHLCVVGDDDQSIYGWRGAQLSNILHFERHFPDPTIIRLEENYRSSHPILASAHSLIKNNPGRREKQLRATRPGGQPVRVLTMPGDEEEALWIVEEILATRKGRKLEDFAILFRTNTQTRPLEKALRERSLPYRMIGAQSYYDRREVRDLIAYTQLLHNPDTDVAQLRILRTPPRGIGESVTLAALDHCRTSHQSLWQTFTDPHFLDLLSTRARNAVSKWEQQLNAHHYRVQAGENPTTVLKELLSELDYDAWLARQCKKSEEMDRRRESMATYLSDLTRSHQSGQKLSTFLDRTLLESERDGDELEDQRGITLITLHASKGLEFPVVFLVGLEEGLLPHRRSLEEGTRDEERRLLYVGMTRAEEQLYLTHCKHRLRYGEKVHRERSSFLDEIDPQHLLVEDYAELMEREADEEELADFFSDLSQLLEKDEEGD